MAVSRIGALALTALAACSFPHGVLSTTDADDDAPAEIDAPEIDARVDGAANVDTDGDGHNDDVDNCPTIANPDQRDFDADLHGDACDHCPHLASTADPDADGDGVGDACDPRPSMAGDARAVWLGFYDSAELTGWTDGNTGGTGTWQLGAAGGLAQVAANPNQFASWAAPGNYQRAYVATSFIIGTPLSQATIGMCSGWDGTSFDCCNVNDRSGSALAEAQTRTSQFDDTTWSPGIAAAERVDIVQIVQAQNVCNFSSGVTTVARQTTPDAISARVLFYMAHTTATFRYLFVVTIGT